MAKKTFGAQARCTRRILLETFLGLKEHWADSCSRGTTMGASFETEQLIVLGKSNECGEQLSQTSNFLAKLASCRNLESCRRAFHGTNPSALESRRGLVTNQDETWRYLTATTFAVNCPDTYQVSDMNNVLHLKFRLQVQWRLIESSCEETLRTTLFGILA